MEIKGLTNSSLIDWDGRISDVVFLGGCNLRCPFCHNADLCDKADAIMTISESNIRNEILRHKTWLGGVVISGGEPLLQDDLINLIVCLQALPIAVKLDTNGTLPDRLSGFIEKKLIDYVAMDLKASPERYNEAVGLRDSQLDFSTLVAKSLLLIDNIDYELRTTIIPGLHDADQIKAMGDFIIGTLGHRAKKWVLQQFVPARARDAHYRTLRPFSEDQIKDLANLAKTYCETCLIRG